MGDLGNRRAARDLWISRGHVTAALVAVFVLSGASFASGYLLGRGPATPRRAEPVVWADQVPGQDLVELLARVEANRSVRGGVEALTFPDALVGAVPVEGPMAPDAAAAEAVFEVPALPVLVTPDVESPPDAAYTVRVAGAADPEVARHLAEGLTLAEMSAWVGAEIVDGELQYVVSAGGFATKEAAEAALLAVGADMRFVGAEVVAIP